MAQKERRGCRASKVDVFDQQIGGDDSFFSRARLKDGRVISDAGDRRGSGRAFSQRTDKLEFVLHALELTTK